ncbi:hypothetical protein Vadar_029044 [Vaccinium darrowii]|uniref:Uncharacterized protein n=1 Tax=Vaccinium darrowii TaxID=229202 RepID=A0ACB7ZMB2_9ERIC|nr:hypothetical protein Vadar_029044 [Vaccinium darrowii]
MSRCIHLFLKRGNPWTLIQAILLGKNYGRRGVRRVPQFQLPHGLKPRRTVFVTVGTTFSDALVQAVGTTEVKEELFWKGYTDLLIQMGRGSYVPMKSRGEYRTLQVDYFTFSSSIAANLRSASLVVSHADKFFQYVYHFTFYS